MNNKALIVVDLSNWLYYTICGSFSAWKKFSENSKFIKPANETDQENLPDLLVFDDYIRTLNEYVQKRLDTINWIVKQNHQDEIDDCDTIDIVFSMDDYTHNSFRKIEYPKYKAQRKVINRQYNINKIRNYILNVIFKNLDLEKKSGYIFIKIEGCESDDIIATIIKKFTDYNLRIILSSDHDFLQLDNVYQYDFAGNNIQRKVVNEILTSEDFLLWKIIRGDVSDNISGVFKGVGEKKALNLIHDKKKLKEMLLENQDSAIQYTINKKIIDFNNIPKDLTDKIYKEVCSKIHSKPEKEKSFVFSDEDMIVL